MSILMDKSKIMEKILKFKKDAEAHMGEFGTPMTWDEMIARLKKFKDNPKGPLEDEIDSILTSDDAEIEAYINNQVKQITPIQDFLQRCKEDLGFTPEVEDTEDPLKFYFLVPEGPPASIRIMQGHALLGLIAHFKNRNWVKDYSYMFIQKTHYGITFQPDFSKTDKL